MTDDDLHGIAKISEIGDWIEARGVRPLFLCVTGSHMWSLARPDSDLDIRGVYLKPTRQILSLHPGRDTIEAQDILSGKVDLQLYELEKAFHMLLNHNGNVVEMLLSPTWFLVDGWRPPEFWQELAAKFLTKRLAHYYRGYFHSQRKRTGMNRGGKALIYTYREIMAGICLLETGRIVYDFHELFKWFREQYTGPEWTPALLNSFLAPEERYKPVSDEKMRRFEAEWNWLMTKLDDAVEKSLLPDDYDGYEALNDLLLDARGWG